MRYAKIKTEFEIEIAPKHYKGIFNFDNHPEAMEKEGFFPLIETEPQEAMKATYQLTQGQIIQSWVELPQDELDALKASKINLLWRNYKQHQTKFIDAEDLILATTLSMAGKPKGTAVRNWVQSLWTAYYIEKDKLETATKAADFTIVKFCPDAIGEPPFSIRELNLEAEVNQ